MQRLTHLTKQNKDITWKKREVKSQKSYPEKAALQSLRRKNSFLLLSKNQAKKDFQRFESEFKSLTDLVLELDQLPPSISNFITLLGQLNKNTWRKDIHVFRAKQIKQMKILIHRDIKKYRLLSLEKTKEYSILRTTEEQINKLYRRSKAILIDIREYWNFVGQKIYSHHLTDAFYKEGIANNKKALIDSATPFIQKYEIEFKADKLKQSKKPYDVPENEVKLAK